MWQISTSYEGHASQAVDGNLNTQYGVGSCTHTHSGHVTPWLTVDLGNRYLIQKVKITNRAGGYGELFLHLEDEINFQIIL